MSNEQISTAALDPGEAREAVVGAVTAIVPDADLASIGDDTPLRDELELDSLDFLAFVEHLTAATGVRIDEADYPRLGTVAGCVAFLTRA